MHIRFKTVTALAFAVLALASRASATSITFDFESSTPTFITPPQAFNRPGALTSLALTNGGETVTITRQNETAFDLVSNTGFQTGKPAGWGTVSLDPFFNPGNSGWIFNFSQPIINFSIQLGDYGEEESDIETLSAWSGPNGTGLLLGLAISDIGVAGFSGIGNPSFGAPGIFSVTMNGVSSSPAFNNSVFLDNLVVTTGDAPVPEPASMVLLGTGLIAVATRYRRRRPTPPNA
jgi:hypothetical protein